MTPRWLCRPCDMLCLGQEHYDRHRAGDHSGTTFEERARFREEQRHRWHGLLTNETPETKEQHERQQPE